MSNAFQSTSLFGGAMTVSMPTGIIDCRRVFIVSLTLRKLTHLPLISSFRQVPDHQEAFVHATGKFSIIVDVMQRVEGFSTDREALEYHIEDVTDAEDTVRVWAVDETPMARFPANVPAITAMVTSHRSSNTDFYGLLFLLIRLVHVGTDILVTINVPHLEGRFDCAEVNLEDGRPGPLLNDAGALRDVVRNTLEIRDWGLFGAGN